MVLGFYVCHPIQIDFLYEIIFPDLEPNLFHDNLDIQEFFLEWLNSH